MQVQYPSCAGIDVGKDSVVVCVRIQRGKNVRYETETFGTMTKDLLSLASWLLEKKCSHALMEATGIYWEPIWYVLEGTVDLIVANATHVKSVPGRKSDVSDAQWLANLLAHGLVKPSFVPPKPIQQLRDLTRTRKQLVQEKGRHVQRLHKALDRCNFKLGSVLRDIVGKSGTAIIKAVIDGETNPDALLRHIDCRVRTPRDKIRAALEGRVTSHERFILKLHLSHVTQLNADLEQIDKEVEQQLEPFRHQYTLLKTIPGIDAIGAAVILAEIGPDMSRFPTAAHLVSWAGLCPRSDKSAGKTRSRRIRKGNPWLKVVLVQAARSAANCKSGYLPAQYRRLASRRGSNKACVAVAASILTAIHAMLTNGEVWNDLGGDYFDRRDPAKAAKRLARRIEALGYAVELKAA